VGHVCARLSFGKVINDTTMSVRGIFEDFPSVVLLIFWLRFSISLPLVFVAMFLIETAFDVEPT
jgi:hypothetical protein